ncbi:SigE family RNA polymerase sigma factor [Streptomyces bungoensis]|uniref:SigE family RNA polymerase sigma factor n=1 Tax=Streptomyces bungoensis TaxID=285568 RepID=UPI00343714D7
MREAPADYLEFAAARSGPLFRTACLLTGDWHLAEDLVQETLAKMYRSWRRISRAQSPVAYADTVLVRTFLSQRRRRSSTERPSDRLPDAAGPARDAELRMALLDGLARMTAKDRAVLVLRYWEDRSVEETARVLHLSPGAVRTRSMRALERLRALLGDQLADLTA